MCVPVTFSWDADDELKLKMDDSAATAAVRVAALQRQEEIVDAHVHLANPCEYAVSWTRPQPARLRRRRWSLSEL